EGVFNKNRLQIRIALVQGSAKPFGRIPLAIIFNGSVLIKDRLEIYRKDFFVARRRLAVRCSRLFAIDVLILEQDWPVLILVLGVGGVEILNRDIWRLQSEDHVVHA